MALQLLRIGRLVGRSVSSTITLQRASLSTGQDEIHIEYQEHPVLKWNEPKNEPLEQKRNRLMYQSRKRGTLENDLLLGNFAGRYLAKMDEKQLRMYDHLINQPSNDWELYYWITGAKPTPKEYDNEVMNSLKEYSKNAQKESRIRQPDLNVAPSK